MRQTKDVECARALSARVESVRLSFPRKRESSNHRKCCGVLDSRLRGNDARCLLESNRFYLTGIRSNGSRRNIRRGGEAFAPKLMGFAPLNPSYACLGYGPV